MSIFTQIKDSVYEPSFYRSLGKQPLSYSFKYFFKFVLLLSLAFTIVLTINWAPRVKEALNEIGPAVASFYPAELVVTIEDGIAITNVPEPFFFDIPAGDFEEGVGRHVDERLEHLLVIDTTESFSVEKFGEYRTLAWLTRDALVVMDDQGIQLIPLAEIPNIIIDRALIDGLTTSLQDFLSAFPFLLLPIGIFIASFVFSASKLIYLLIAALLIWLLTKIMGQSAGYAKSYQIGLHAVTLGMILLPVLHYLFPGVSFSFDFTILMLIIVWANLKVAEVPKQA
ncbi:MAG: DUF1189 family protein [Patescibacteria group bacterium]|nr:DUF1189 family protein [Patescibacteria group bacterium]